VYNWHLKISASKQHLPIQGGQLLSMCGVFFCLCTKTTKIICCIPFKNKIYILTLSLCARVPLNDKSDEKTFDTLCYTLCNNFNIDSWHSNCHVSHHTFSKLTTFQVQNLRIFSCFCTWKVLGLAKIWEGTPGSKNSAIGKSPSPWKSKCCLEAVIYKCKLYTGPLLIKICTVAPSIA